MEGSAVKYASEVIGLLGAHPGREFRMAQIIRHVSRGADVAGPRRNALRIGVYRVLQQLVESGQVQQSKTGATASVYYWSPNCYTDMVKIDTQTVTIQAAQLRP